MCFGACYTKFLCAYCIPEIELLDFYYFNCCYWTKAIHVFRQIDWNILQKI